MRGKRIKKEEKPKKIHIKLKQLTLKQYVTIGVVLILLGVIILLSNYFLSKKANAYEDTNLDLSDLSEEKIIEKYEGDKSDSDGDNVIYYIGKLEIPSIGLEKGFPSKNSKDNDVNKNIILMPEAAYPDQKYGNLIIVGHTGNGWNCFFKNLYKLQNGAVAYVYYNNVKYTYEMVNKYDVKKTGTVEIKRDSNKTVMTLITCTKGTKDKQSVFIFNQIKEEKY